MILKEPLINSYRRYRERSEMYRILPNDCASVILAGMFLCSFVASASEIEPSASIGMEYTDNVTLVPVNEARDLIVNTSVGAEIDAGSGPFRFNASTSLTSQHYTKGTFDDRKYFNLGATVGWEMLKNRFDWTLQDFFSQRAINSLDPDTPDNIQDTNVLTFGPNIYFPVSARQSITLQPEYRKFTYKNGIQVQNLDNQQNSIAADWNYQMFRTMSVGLSGRVNKVDYGEQSISDNTFSNIGLTVSGGRSRSNYSVNMGSTRVERGRGGNTGGFTGNIIWLFNLTGYSNVRTYIASNLIDTNNGLLNASRNPENGDISNQQISGEVLRNSILRVTYTKKGATLSSSVWSELSRQEYELVPLDREVQDLGMRFSYPLTAALSMGVSTRYNRIELTDIDRKDKQYDISSNINYRLSRRLSTVLSLRYRDRNSTLDTADYSAMSVFANLVYGSGSASR